MIYTLYIISLLAIIIFLTDAIPQLNTWLSRIKIGRFASPQVWENKILTISKKWLQNMPTVPLTDNSRLIIIDMLKGNYRRTTIQSWQEAALILGLTEYITKTGDPQTQKEVEDFLVAKTTPSGSWKMKPTESDHVMLAYSFLNAEFIGHAKYKAAFIETYNMILSLKGEDGTVAYKSHVREYRFVDTIGFICPFLVNFGLKFNQPEAIDLAVKQIIAFEKYGIMSQEKIPCHTYNIYTKIPTGLFGWGRGLGWFLIGLADSFLPLPAKHPQKSILKKIIVEVAHSVLKFQQKDGSFTWLIFDEKSRKDSSTVAAAAYFFAAACAIPELNTECTISKEKCFDYLKTVTRRNGAIDFSQGDTKGIGVYSQNFDMLPFTQGFALRTLNYSPTNAV